MSLRRIGLGAATALAVTAATASVSGETDTKPSPQALLTEATNAIRDASYRGVLINLQAGDVSVLQIFHRRVEGAAQQRLVALNGPPREIIRKGSERTAVLPTKELVLISHLRPTSALGGFTQVDVKKIEKSYSLKHGEMRRIAGRYARVLRIVPEDEFRYGYRLALDHDTRLPLKLTLVDDDAVLERIMFAQIQFMQTMPDRLFESQHDLSGYRVIKHQSSQKSAKKQIEVRWSTTKLPPGFERVASGARKVSEDTVIRQILFSDGLASVSAFIAPIGLRAPLKGSTSRGPVNAFGVQTASRQITVVGEVPAVTVKLIATHLQRESATK